MENVYESKKGRDENGRHCWLYFYPERDTWYPRKKLVTLPECVIGESLLFVRLKKGCFTIHECLTNPRHPKGRRPDEAPITDYSEDLLLWNKLDTLLRKSL